MRIPPLPCRSPFQLMPVPSTEVTRSIGVTADGLAGGFLRNISLLRVVRYYACEGIIIPLPVETGRRMPSPDLSQRERRALTRPLPEGEELKTAMAWSAR